MPALVWRQADDDVHVATAQGEYAGFTDAGAGGVRAHGAQAEDLGVHPTQALARQAVAAAAAASTRPPKVSLARRLRRTAPTGRRPVRPS